jgi:hypothetical protein
MTVIQHGFGQPPGAIMQVAYVVPQLREALALWTQELRVGPFFLFEDFTLDDLLYRGRPSQLNISLACGYSGSMCIELIQQHDREPSVYRDVIESRGYGLHHCAIMTNDFDGDQRRLQASIGPLAMYGVTKAAPARVAYIDARATLGSMLELIELTPGSDALFTMMKQAAAGWDGSDPVRSGNDIRI